MKTQHFDILINAPREHVWRTIFGLLPLPHGPDIYALS
jgi:hypothetical protein